MTVALCLPRNDSFAWHNASISDLDLSDDEIFESSSFFMEANTIKSIKHKMIDFPSMSLTELIAAPPAKRQKIEEHDLVRLIVREDRPAADLLHQACLKSTVTLPEIEALIKSDPSAPTRTVVVVSEKVVYDFATASKKTKQVKEPYGYPLNLAIKNNAPQDVIDYLIEVGPSVLMERDGQQQENSLMILLKHTPNSSTLVDKMLLSTPQCALLSDHKNNTSLHIACRSNAPLVVIRHLAIIHPRALGMANFWLQTPLDIVQASATLSTDDVSIYLWERQFHSEEE